MNQGNTSQMSNDALEDFSNIRESVLRPSINEHTVLNSRTTYSPIYKVNHLHQHNDDNRPSIE